MKTKILHVPIHANEYIYNASIENYQYSVIAQSKRNSRSKTKINHEEHPQKRQLNTTNVRQSCVSDRIENTLGILSANRCHFRYISIRESGGYCGSENWHDLWTAALYRDRVSDEKRVCEIERQAEF